MNKTTRICKFCNLKLVHPTNFYLLSKIVTCLSCRRVYYAVWKEINQLCILKYIEHKNSPPNVAKAIFHCLNSEKIKSFCYQFLDFSSIRNYTRCPILAPADSDRGHDGIKKTVNPNAIRKIRQSNNKYLRLCRLCRFRKMFLTVREIPKSKLILKIDNFTESEIKILKMYAVSDGQNTLTQNSSLTIHFGDELAEIFFNSFSIFDYIHESIREIETSGGYSDLTTISKEVKSSGNIAESLHVYKTLKFEAKIDASCDMNTGQVTHSYKNKNIVAYTFPKPKVQKFYDLQQNVTRFHEVYSINTALNDMFQIFQTYSQKIELDIARIRKQQNLDLTSNCVNAIELIPLSRINQPVGIMSYDASNSKNNCEIEVGTDMDLNETIKELETYANNLLTKRHRPADKKKLESIFDSLGDLKTIFSREIEQVNRTEGERDVSSALAQII